jgi:2-keto-4-pentenoate hydratase
VAQELAGGHAGAASPPPEYGERGRSIYGPTEPGRAVPVSRVTALTDREADEVVAIIARGRQEGHGEELPEPLRTREWGSVMRVLLALDETLGRPGVGWKVGAASQEIRRAEGLPGPCPGVLYQGTVFPSGSVLPSELFINYRNCECELAFYLAKDFPARDEPYTELDARAGIDYLVPVLEIGDMVFSDWYGASAYFGSCLDNGGGAALVHGSPVRDWQDVPLAASGMDAYLNGRYIKSGSTDAAMGNPVTSLTWLLNWSREHGRDVRAGEVVSTGTCTGHLFAARGDTVRADFGPLGVVEANFG